MTTTAVTSGSMPKSNGADRRNEGEDNVFNGFDRKGEDVKSFCDEDWNSQR